MALTQPRQNYHAESEAGVNKQINLELYASYVYQSMVSEKEIYANGIRRNRDSLLLHGLFQIYFLENNCTI